jgi:rhamnose transport system permease protein
MANKDTSVIKKILNYRQFGLLVCFVILIALSAIITPAMFTVDSIMSMLRNNSVYAILAVGMMIIIITGGIDLSLASTLFQELITTSVVNIHARLEKC